MKETYYPQIEVRFKRTYLDAYGAIWCMKTEQYMQHFAHQKSTFLVKRRLGRVQGVTCINMNTYTISIHVKL